MILTTFLTFFSYSSINIFIDHWKRTNSEWNYKLLECTRVYATEQIVRYFTNSFPLFILSTSTASTSLLPRPLTPRHRCRIPSRLRFLESSQLAGWRTRLPGYPSSMAVASCCKALMDPVHALPSFARVYVTDACLPRHSPKPSWLRNAKHSFTF